MTASFTQFALRLNAFTISLKGVFLLTDHRPLICAAQRRSDKASHYRACQLDFILQVTSKGRGATWHHQSTTKQSLEYKKVMQTCITFWTLRYWTFSGLSPTVNPFCVTHDQKVSDPVLKLPYCVKIHLVLSQKGHHTMITAMSALSVCQGTPR